MASADDPAKITERFTVGGVLTDLRTLVGRWPVEFFGLFLVVAVPQVVFALVRDDWLQPVLIESAGDVRAATTTLAGGLLLAAAVAAVVDVWTRAAVAVAVSDGLRDLPPDLGRCLRNVVVALPRLTFVGLLYGLGIGVPTALAIFLVGNGTLAGSALTGGAIIGAAILVFLVVIWWVQIPVLLLEAQSPMKSFGRSFVLMGGEGATIFGLVLVIGAPKFGIELILRLGLDQSGLVSRIAGDGVDCLYVFVLAMAATASYYRLRAQKEGIAIRDIARVFD